MGSRLAERDFRITGYPDEILSGFACCLSVSYRLAIFWAMARRSLRSLSRDLPNKR